MLLIYTDKVTPRFNYTMKHVFNHLLGVDIAFTSNDTDVMVFEGAKMTYGKHAFGKEFFVKSSDLLFEQGISDVEIHLGYWDEVPCFFQIKEASHLPFDVFAATFYLISRYEEYLPHVKDKLGRYPAEESLAFKHNFLEIPVVDFWALKLKELLLTHFPELTFEKKHFTSTPVIDVAEAYKFKNKGLVRMVGASLIDIWQFKFGNLLKRLKVLFNKQTDPFDTFEMLIELQKKQHKQFVFFFSVADFGTYDRNASFNNQNFKALIKSMADYGVVSLLAGFEACISQPLLKEERERLTSLLNRPVKRVRSKYAKTLVPETYKIMVNAGFNEDYSMGYNNNLGFKAGTCSPFYLYDISFEEQLPIKIVPFCVSHTALIKLEDPKRARYKTAQLLNSIKKVQGVFVPILSNEVLMNNKGGNPFTALFYDILNDSL